MSEELAAVLEFQEEELEKGHEFEEYYSLVDHSLKVGENTVHKYYFDEII